MFTALLGIQALERADVGHADASADRGSEESGSPDLEAHLDELQAHLGRVDLLVCLDSVRSPTTGCGSRRRCAAWSTLHVTVEVMRHGVHSGTAGGVVPSSFRILRELLDRVRTPDREVLLRGLHTESRHHLAAAGVVAKDSATRRLGLPVVEASSSWVATARTGWCDVPGAVAVRIGWTASPHRSTPRPRAAEHDRGPRRPPSPTVDAEKPPDSSSTP